MKRTRTSVVWAAVVLTIAGHFASPYLHHWRVTSDACAGGLPDGALDALTPDGERLKDETSRQVDGLGWYSCDVSMEHDDGGGERYLVRMNAFTRRDDQDRRFMSSFQEDLSGVMATPSTALPDRLPGFVDRFGAINLLLPCPDLGEDDDGRPRGMLVQTRIEQDGDASPVPGVPLRVAVALADTASDRLGCGAKPLKAPASDVVLPTGDEVGDSKEVSLNRVKGTSCAWLAGSELPPGRHWHAFTRPVGASPLEYCEVSAAARPGHDPDKDDVWLGFHAWYGDWSNRFLFKEYSGEPHPMTATARCAAEAGNYLLDTSEDAPVSEAVQRRLLRDFATYQAHRHGCPHLRFTF